MATRCTYGVTAMKFELLCIALVFVFALRGAPADDTAPLTLSGWGIDSKDPDTFCAEAAAVGFDTLITWSTDPVYLAKAVEAGQKHGIGIYSSLAPMGGLASFWKKTYPDRPVPWQVMTEAQNAACSFIMAGENAYIIPYQFGGEPVMTNEVLGNQIICMSDPDALALLEAQTDAIVAVAGLEGLAFDGFGYQNYHRCHCERCERLLEEYMKAHADMSAADAEIECFRDMLVGYVNHLAAYARAKRPDIRTSIHIWPVFAPEPLYGNRLDIDYCGQTAAWYMLWPQEKIAEYSRIIAGDANKYFPRQQGVGMIGYYDKPGKFPVKDAERVDMELRTMVENGCRAIQVCGAADVIKNPEIAVVFGRYFK